MKFFVGYDLGDGETMVHLLKGIDSEKLEGIALPGEENAKPIPTVFSIKLKEGKEIVSVGQDAIKSRGSIQEFHINVKRRPSTKDGQSLTELKNSIVNFTNGIFSDQRVVSFITDGAEEIHLFIGHPTTWNEKDIEIYHQIFQQTVLGKGWLEKIRLHFHLEKESMAAFLQSRASKQFKIDQLQKGSHAVVFDFGSSTTDVTVISGLKVDDSLKDEGDPNLGARLIDQAIYEYVHQAMSEEDREDFDRFRRNPKNQGVKKKYIYFCRQAKEDYFSTRKDSREDRGFGPSPRRFDIPEYLDHQAMQVILNQKMPELGNISWQEASQRLFKRVKQDMASQGKEPVIVVLTGGAAMMDFVYEQCKSVFESERCTVMRDPNPGEAISRGLALLARSNYRADQFEQAINVFCEQNLAKLIAGQVNYLADMIAPDMATLIIDDVVKPEAYKWKYRDYGYENLNKMESNAVREAERVLNGPKGKEILEKAGEKWLRERLFPEIDRQTATRCQQYGVNNLQLKNLAEKVTAFRDGKINYHFENLSARGDIGHQLTNEFSSTLISLVAMLSSILLPIIIVVVIPVISTIIALITSVIVLILVVVFGVNPHLWPPLAASLGVSAAVVLLGEGWDALKDSLMQQGRTIDFPRWVRDLVSKSKISNEVNGEKSNIEDSISRAIKSNENIKEEIGEQIAREIKKLVQQCVRMIRLKIES